MGLVFLAHIHTIGFGRRCSLIMRGRRQCETRHTASLDRGWTPGNQGDRSLLIISCRAQPIQVSLSASCMSAIMESNASAIHNYWTAVLVTYLVIVRGIRDIEEIDDFYLVCHGGHRGRHHTASKTHCISCCWRESVTESCTRRA